MWRFGIVFAVLIGCPALAQNISPKKGMVQCEREADCLSELKSIVTRKGNILYLRFENGAAEAFKEDRQACEEDDGEKCLRLNLRAYRPAQYVYVVQWRGYEESGSLIISSKTGASITLPSLPHFSPSGRWFASIDPNPYEGSEYAVAIWSTAPDKPKQVFRYRIPEKILNERWEFIEWDGDDRIKFKVTFDKENGATQESMTSADRTQQGWNLNWPLPNSK
ncbi:hypothetical protein [Microvirga sp. VF16]|uniref:hypothetical protein n=1 Tax=Microvirga sp. VF16 TaxID=2807101 RepID=UPI00193E7806|nr:hypothetical protein [Microvirga sp. VF16]QRM29587.1 hypothetical protein JO965_00715 [Microvirga sp. VF16]